MAPPSTLRLPDGRTVAFDDVGDPAGPVVVYLHGLPDSRLGRPPDELTSAAGVRLVAVDRPGVGGSSRDLVGTLGSHGVDLEHLLDHLGVTQVLLLGWSAGGLHALAAASTLGSRVAGVGVVATVPPVEAYADDALVGALAPSRRQLATLAIEGPARELAEELADYLVPDPLSPELALEHVAEGAGEQGRRELDEVPGAWRALADGLQASVESGVGGLVDDLARQLEPGLDLSRIEAPVRCWHGTDDGTSPPEVGAWLVGHLPAGVLDVSRGAGHHLLFPRWPSILRALRRDAGI